ncbi:MAG: tRNA (adenosine(37)-N6)-threonylcarbamoyltransferase complex dimerization subunit type 1 TsaB [Parvularculaceae bacterium]
MLILSIDTAFDACSAAITDGIAVLWMDQKIIGRGHSEILPPMVAGGFGIAGVGARDLGRIGVVIGPGAFAGVRVGLAFARALRIGLKAEVVGVSSNEALAASMALGPEFLAPVFDARRGQVYAALYDAALNECLAPFVAAPAEASARIAAAAGAGRLTLAGSGAALMTLDRPYTVDPVMHADPVALARRAGQKPASLTLPAPLYLRPPDAAPARASLFAGFGGP